MGAQYDHNGLPENGNPKRLKKALEYWGVKAKPRKGKMRRT